MQSPILLRHLSLSFAHKDCFTDFSATVSPGSRVAIIGRNGSGKSSLLHILRGTLMPTYGDVFMPHGLSIGYVEQTITEMCHLSGGERLYHRLSEVLARNPDLLFLDEPTNHLDEDNRKSLFRMLRRYPGTLMMVSHDSELLRTQVDTLWHIDNNAVHVFDGDYDAYLREIRQKRAATEHALASLKREKEQMHQALMKEQQRSSKSQARGKKSADQKKWPAIISQSKARMAEKTSGKKKASLDKKKQSLMASLSTLRLPETLLPKFSLEADHISSDHILSIREADLGYAADTILLTDIHLSLKGRERIAIRGKNGSGKSTLLKAILGEGTLFKTGHWHSPARSHMGYLDQHYRHLDPTESVIGHIRMQRPDWTEREARRHLNDFLFRKNEEVMQKVENLSGGEKARLSLSLIAAKTPRVLILDELTNNLDLETKEYVIQVIKAYPGAVILISHEDDFLEAIGVDCFYSIDNGKIAPYF